MHINHRRKNGRYRSGWPRYRVSLAEWKREFWRQRRAIERDCMVNHRFDDLVDRIPRSLLWEAL